MPDVHASRTLCNVMFFGVFGKFNTESVIGFYGMSFNIHICILCFRQALTRVTALIDIKTL